MAVNFDNVDVNTFGYALNDGIDMGKLDQAKRQLEAARDRAERDVQMRQVVLRQAGHTEATFESDDTWRGLKAKADRLDHLRYAVLQKLHMERAKSEAQLQSGPRLYQVTQADCQQKKAAYDQAVAEVTMAKQNALDFGPDLPDVREHVDYLAKQAGIRRAEYQLVAAKFGYNEKREAAVAAYDSLLASARKLCMAGTEGERLCLGLLLKWERESFGPVATAYNAAANKVNEAIKNLATVSGPTSGSDASAATAALPSTAATSTSASATSSTAALSTATTAASRSDSNNQLVATPHFRPSGLGTADFRQSSSATQRDFEELLATVYGAGSPTAASGAQAQASVLQSVSGTRLTTTTTTTTQRLGRWTVTETSVVQVHEQFAAVRLTQLTMSWEDIFGSTRAQCQQLSLVECIDNGDHDGIDESIVLHACLVRPEVTAVHVRLLLRYLGYPTVTWVKRGHSDRRGPREDCAWIKFRTLDEARDCKWRWDGMGHWGLTAWDDYNNQPRPLHFSFSTHPAYKGKKQ